MPRGAAGLVQVGERHLGGGVPAPGRPRQPARRLGVVARAAVAGGVRLPNDVRGVDDAELGGVPPVGQHLLRVVREDVLAEGLEHRLQRQALALGEEERGRLAAVGVGAAQPDEPLVLVLRQAVRGRAGEVELGEGELRFPLPLLGGPPQPLEARGRVLRHAQAGLVQRGEAALRPGVPLLGGVAVPGGGAGGVLRHAVAGLEAPGELDLRRGFAGRGGGAQLRKRPRRGRAGLLRRLLRRGNLLIGSAAGRRERGDQQQRQEQRAGHWELERRRS